MIKFLSFRFSFIHFSIYILTIFFFPISFHILFMLMYFPCFSYFSGTS